MKIPGFSAAGKMGGSSLKKEGMQQIGRRRYEKESFITDDGWGSCTRTGRLRRLILRFSGDGSILRSVRGFALRDGGNERGGIFRFRKYTGGGRKDGDPGFYCRQSEYGYDGNRAEI
jgi:hypothetical protein